MVKNEPTPMMRQYHEAKQTCGDALLFFRMGDFYELFFEDAKTAASLLGLTLTSRDKGENPIPMAGFPHHQLDGYLAKVIKSGQRAAVCEQVEDPKTAKGIVKRQVTRVVTPGTVTDEELLDPAECNYLAAVIANETQSRFGIAWVDISTGRFLAGEFTDLDDELSRIRPSECLVSQDATPLLFDFPEMMTTRQPGWSFGLTESETNLCRHFAIKNLDGFGFDATSDSLAIRAAGAILAYLQETQRNSLQHVSRLAKYQTGHTLEIDQATRRSLEITRTIRDGSRDGSLLGAIQRTQSPMGSRLFADWLNNPLTDRSEIQRRLDSVDELLAANDLRQTCREFLQTIYDLERLNTKVITGRTSPRDLVFIGRTLASLPGIKGKLASCQSQLLIEIESRINPCPEVRERVESAFQENAPLSPRESGFIKPGFSDPLDQLRELATGGKQWIANYQKQIMEESGISSLKVGFNKVFGYFLEVTHTHRDKVPEHFIRKQTLKNAERYITPELKEYEEKVLAADDQALELEYELFVEIRDFVQSFATVLQTTAIALAELDVLLSLSEIAAERNYCRPNVIDDAELKIIEGRHPVLDVIEADGTFIPNDSIAGADDGMVMVITGPNMAGKSTYIRQTALICLLAQVGSFVPAKSATVGIADRIFARVGASDELARGQSTFMVEMTETARILNTASSRSLVILDEIGRGTSTYDGLSLAWAIVEYLHDRIGCRTFFATHYHELTELQNELNGLRNLNVSVKEWDDTVVFLHKIIAGSADKSYGIHVARLAGIPGQVNERAKEILSHLENDHLQTDLPAPNPQRSKSGELQLTLFGFEPHPLINEIKQADLNSLTPLDAFKLIEQWQQSLGPTDPTQNLRN
ncbi:MAG: DNA mismatch repair protein MutS [Planctomycetota bacterium]|nr:DNA mismatch repair protein MutS [Planctomycetota bacterium]